MPLCVVHYEEPSLYLWRSIRASLMAFTDNVESTDSIICIFCYLTVSRVFITSFFTVKSRHASLY